MCFLLPCFCHLWSFGLSKKTLSQFCGVLRRGTIRCLFLVGFLNPEITKSCFSSLWLMFKFSSPYKYPRNSWLSLYLIITSFVHLQYYVVHDYIYCSVCLFVVAVVYFITSTSLKFQECRVYDLSSLFFKTQTHVTVFS